MTSPSPAPRPVADAFQTFGAFFAAQVQWLKDTEPRFSYRWLAKRLGLKSHTLLLRFAQGTQLPTPDLLGRLAEVLKLGSDEAVYLRALVGREGAKGAEEREFFDAKASGIRRQDTPRRRLELDAFDLVSQWHNAAIVEMAGTARFRDDPAWIAGQLRGAVTVDAVRDSLGRLERLGLLTRTPAGALTRAREAVVTPTDIPSAAIRTFHGQMLDLAKGALEEVPVKARFFYGQTLAFDPERLGEAQALLVEFRARFQKLMEGGNASRVYHLGMQFVPLTRDLGEAD